jgi:hypothetical protein
MKLLHDADQVTCSLVLEPETVPGTWLRNRHLELKCEDCEAHGLLSGVSLAQVEDRYREGRITQPTFEAYSYVWTHLARHLSFAPMSPPACESARRVARKLWRMWYGEKGVSWPAYPPGLEESGADC